MRVFYPGNTKTCGRCHLAPLTVYWEALGGSVVNKEAQVFPSLHTWQVSGKNVSYVSGDYVSGDILEQQQGPAAQVFKSAISGIPISQAASVQPSLVVS